MRRLRQADLGHGRHNHAWFEAAFDCTVWAAYLMATRFEWDFGAAIAKQLGSVDKSAWLAVRQAAPRVAPGRAPLAGLVEVDETEIPLRTKTDPVCGGGGRSPQGKMLVAGAVEVENDAPGRLRLAAIQDFSAASLHGFVAANVAPGATIKTDGRPSYARAPDVRHEPHVVGAMAAHVVLPGSTAPSPTPRPGRSASITDSREDSISKLPRRIRLPLQPTPNPTRSVSPHFSQSPSSESR